MVPARTACGPEPVHGEPRYLDTPSRSLCFVGLTQLTVCFEPCGSTPGALPCPVVHTSTFRYPTMGDLAAAIAKAQDTMRLPVPDPDRVRPGEWVLAVFEFHSSARATAAAARVIGDRHAAYVVFERRDWERLTEFSQPPPADDATEVRDAAPTIPELMPPLGVPSVLVVEDDRLAREVIRTFLEDDGWGVVAVSSGEEASALIANHTFALVVLDWTLPGKSGLELCIEIRSQQASANVPVLFLTANTSVEASASAFAAGANDFIRKPVEAAELRARVRAILSRSGKFRRSVAG